MPPAANSHDFDLLNAGKSYATDGVDAKTGKVVTPVRLPHIRLLARLHLGIDATSYQAERNSPLPLLSSATYKVTWEGARLR